MSWNFFLTAILAYLLGSVPTGKLIASLHGVDIQKKGSGNIGFANVLRVVGRVPAAIVLTIDVLKGFVPVAIAQQILGASGVQAVALLAIMGHVFPVWLKFKGGKGIATGLGVTLAISPVLAVLCVLV